EKIPTIQLLTPNGNPKGIIETEHNSKWENIKDRNIDSQLTDKQLRIMKELIQNNQWIIEESNDILQILSILEVIYKSSNLLIL
ncbi:MAG: hypothetical protein ABIW77_07820, partial [Gelidibacter sp.]